MPSGDASEVILAIDSAWQSSGWAICIASGPLKWGTAKPDGTWKAERFAATIADLRDRAAVHALARDLPLRLVVERPPLHHGGVVNERNARRTLRSVAELAGAVFLASGGWEDWRSPWRLEPKEWRSWWGLRGRREALKRAAIRTAVSAFPQVRGSIIEGASGADDAAEAVLIGTGAARRTAEAPTGPARQTASGVRSWGAVPPRRA